MALRDAFLGQLPGCLTLARLAVQCQLGRLLPVPARRPAVSTRIKELRIDSVSFGEPIHPAFRTEQLDREPELFVGQRVIVAVLIELTEQGMSTGQSQAFIEFLGQVDGLLDYLDALGRAPGFQVKLSDTQQDMA